jgi:hypothetical protein
MSAISFELTPSDDFGKVGPHTIPRQRRTAYLEIRLFFKHLVKCRSASRSRQGYQALVEVFGLIHQRLQGVPGGL